MKILGISAFYHDSASSLLDQGEILAAAQEERWTRKKHDPSFPTHSIRFCLDKIISLSKEKLSYKSALKQTDMDFPPLRRFLSKKRRTKKSLN